MQNNTVFFKPVVKVGLGRVAATGDKLLGGAIDQQAFDLGTIRIEFAFARSRRSLPSRMGASSTTGDPCKQRQERKPIVGSIYGVNPTATAISL
jgi:hypothetical protein